MKAKKLLVVLCAAVMCLSLGILGACSHEHDWSAWEVTTAATCTEKGVETRTCDCGETETRDINALGHDWGEWEVTTAATMFADGTETRACERTGCTETETRAVTALGKTASVIDAFNFYNDNLSVSGNGVKLGQIADESDGTKYGGAIGIAVADGDDDGVYDLENGTVTVGFDLNLSAFEENDYTLFSLNFLKYSDAAAGREYVTECIFGIVKTADGYVFAPLNGVNYTEADRDAVLNSESKITVIDSDGILSLGYKVTYDDSQEAETDKLGCSLMINGEEKIVFDVYYNPGNEHVDGLGTLWNATSNVDTAVLSDLTLA